MSSLSASWAELALAFSVMMLSGRLNRGTAGTPWFDFRARWAGERGCPGVTGALVAGKVFPNLGLVSLCFLSGVVEAGILLDGVRTSPLSSRIGGGARQGPGGSGS